MALRTELRRGLREHRPFFWAATAMFVLGALLGAALVGRFDLFAWLGIESFEDLVPAEITVLGLYLNNARALLLMIAGVLTAGLLTVFALVFNGVILGYVALPIASQEGPLFIVVGILPHGILELPALFLGGAIAFRIVTNTALRIVGRRDVVLGRDGWKRAGLLVVLALVMLAVAAVIEIYVTAWLLGLLFG